MCLILLEEKVSARKDLMFKERNDIDISDGFIQLSNKLSFLEGSIILILHLLYTCWFATGQSSRTIVTDVLSFHTGRRVLDMKFNAVQTHLLLTAYDCNNIESNVDKNLCLYGRGVVCYWNVNEPSQPQK